MNSPKVSVIIPTYNRLEKCRRTVQSVLDQTFQDFEILLIDDGSVDDTATVIPKMSDKIRYIYQENQGCLVARNNGMMEARGEYIAFLDSDDTWVSWKLELQVKYLNKYKDCGLVWTDMKAVNENYDVFNDKYIRTMYGAYNYFKFDEIAENIIPVREVFPEILEEYADANAYQGNFYSWMFMGSMAHTSVVLFRKEILKRTGLYETSFKKQHGCYDFYLRIARLNKIAFIDVPTLNYMVGASDQITRPELQFLAALNTLRSIQKAFLFHKDEVFLPNNLLKTRFAKLYKWIGMSAVGKDKAAARKYFLKSLCIKVNQPRLIYYVVISFIPGFMRNFLKKVHGK